MSDINKNNDPAQDQPEEKTEAVETTDQELDEMSGAAAPRALYGVTPN